MWGLVISSFKNKVYKELETISDPVQLNSLNMLKAWLKNFAFHEKKTIFHLQKGVTNTFSIYKIIFWIMWPSRLKLTVKYVSITD